MVYQDVFDLVSNQPNKSANLTIITNSGNKYKQNIYVSSANTLKIRGINSNIVGYNVDQVMASNWAELKLIQKRKKEDKDNI